MTTIMKNYNALFPVIILMVSVRFAKTFENSMKTVNELKMSDFVLLKISG